MPRMFQISEELSGLRLDKALAFDPEIKTRSRAARLIDQGCIKKNSLSVRASQITQAGELYSVEIPSVAPASLEAYPYELEIIFEDKNLMVINKPAGLVVHPAAGHS